MKISLLILLFTASIFAQSNLLLLMGDAKFNPVVNRSSDILLGIEFGSGVTKDANNKVTQWNDLSANAHNFIQADTSKSPTYTVNGMFWDGTNDFMATASFTSNQPRTVYIVGQSSDVTGVRGFVDGATALTGAVYFTGGTINSRAGTLLVGDAASINTWYVITAVFNTTSSTIQLNDVAANSGDAGSSNVSNGFCVGARGTAGFLNGYIKAVYIMTGVDDDAEQIAMKEYLNTKYEVY